MRSTSSSTIDLLLQAITLKKGSSLKRRCRLKDMSESTSGKQHGRFPLQMAPLTVNQLDLIAHPEWQSAMYRWTALAHPEWPLLKGNGKQYYMNGDEDETYGTRETMERVVMMAIAMSVMIHNKMGMIISVVMMVRIGNE